GTAERVSRANPGRIERRVGGELRRRCLAADAALVSGVNSECLQHVIVASLHDNANGPLMVVDGKVFVAADRMPFDRERLACAASRGNRRAAVAKTRAAPVLVAAQQADDLGLGGEL